jgi:hypothetical protein
MPSRASFMISTLETTQPLEYPLKPGRIVQGSYKRSAYSPDATEILDCRSDQLRLVNSLLLRFRSFCHRFRTSTSGLAGKCLG